MAAPIALSFLLLQAAAAAAPAAPAMVASITPAPATRAAPAPVAETPDPVMCDYVAVSGSPMTQKVCHKASVWARMARGD